MFDEAAHDGDARLREVDAELRQLTDDYRVQCLWFLRRDLYPADREQALRVLRYIETHGDREGFIRAARLRRWLSPTSSEPSGGRITRARGRGSSRPRWRRTAT
ncbi:MAG TPA: hypothetical protein VKU40_13835, partial [Thermoanaerobaculia bacterium]|nr:hypothetical protein [Thermoanaerobaculia bacterium]